MKAILIKLNKYIYNKFLHYFFISVAILVMNLLFMKTILMISGFDIYFTAIDTLILFLITIVLSVFIAVPDILKAIFNKDLKEIN